MTDPIPPPFPLGSSVSYWIMGIHHLFGFRVVNRADVRAGDIAIMGAHGDPMQGNGPNGHTAVVDHVAGGTVVTMESYGHHGIGFKARPMGFWSGFVRWDRFTDAHLQAMREFVFAYSADTGTVAHIGYSASGGDNDNDGTPNRADLDSGAVDCSGFVWIVFTYAVRRVAARVPVAAPKPPPPLPTSEEPNVFWYPIDRAWHFFYVDPITGDLMHTWPGDGFENMTKRYGGIGPLDPRAPVHVGLVPDTFGTVIELHAVGAPTPEKTVWPVKGRFEGNPIRWHLTAQNPATAKAA